MTVDEHWLAEEAARARTGDLAAFGRIVAACQAALRGYLARLGVPGPQQEELAQETFVAAFTTLGRWDGTRPFMAWLWGIARHRVLQHRERQARARRLTALDAVGELMAAAPDEDAIDPGAIVRLRRCLGELSRPAADLLRLRYDEALPASEIARRLGKEPNAVRMMLLRVRTSLRRCIEREPERA